jgi:hypothetical protein
VTDTDEWGEERGVRNEWKREKHQKGEATNLADSSRDLSAEFDGKLPATEIIIG